MVHTVTWVAFRVHAHARKEHLNSEANSNSKVAEQTPDFVWKSNVVRQLDLRNDLVETYQDLELIPQRQRVSQEMPKFLELDSEA